MRIKRIILPLWLLLFACKSFAQYTVTGKITNRTDKKPVAFATALLNNTSWGVASTDSGNFILKGVRPGHYQLIVSFIGYEQYKTDVTVTGNIKLPVIELVPENRSLQEVKITAKFKLSWHFNDFKKEFLGQTDFANQCKILNPEILHFDYDAVSHTLHVTSKDFLRIENDALGYMVRYRVNDFTKNEDSGSIYYEGATYFEEMKGTPAQQQQWKTNRMHTYQGSSMEFLRALIDGKFGSKGYTVNRLIRKPNPYYDPKKDATDSRYLQKFIDTPMEREKFVVRTDQKDVFALTSAPDTCLYVRYYHTSFLSPAEKKLYRRSNDKYALFTIITFNSAYAFFDYNGVVLNPASIGYEGYFGQNRVGNQLPNDFQPTQ